ncbi:hypothetical protein HOLleu_01422 [Holothuria leucospilota]|uniref:Uncharacterized protein n=1 Tax=Holothuria leucospilota TaxID=206669 RepID=A0A9Q1HJ82_HOLLE|nr:hypothetical protein HOLleu_01422 [Holothuria leucospilota]
MRGQVAKTVLTESMRKTEEGSLLQTANLALMEQTKKSMPATERVFVYTVMHEIIVLDHVRSVSEKELTALEKITNLFKADFSGAGIF